MAPYGGAGYQGIGIAFQPNKHVSRSAILELLRRMKILVFLISLAFRRSLMMLNLLRLPLKHGLMLNRQILLLPCRMLPEIWACNDTNGCYPSTSSIQEYAKVARILPNRVTKLTFLQ